MTEGSLTDAGPALRPIAAAERITALDVVRGVALIGIFLMNIEWFNRPIAELGIGLPTTATGADWWAGYLIYILVQGKFWTMFSLLFGMGFAVMLTRAERAGRNFLVPYIRRIAALAVFGALHHIFLWGGDILFSYAVAAMCLLLVMWARWYVLVLLPVAMFAVGIAGQEWAFQVAAGMVVVALAAWFLRGEMRLGRLSVQSLFFLLVSAVMLVFAGMMGTVGEFPAEGRWPLLIGASFFGLIGWLSARYKDPVEARPRRLGGTMYLVPFSLMLAFGLLQLYGPARPKPTEAQVATAMVEAKAQKAAAEAAKEAGKPAPKPDEAAARKKSEAEKAAMGEAQRRLNQAEHEADAAKERHLQTQGSYMEFVRYRAAEFGEHAAGEFGFAAVLIGMFLLGYWFVRKGIMEQPEQHLPLFRKMALVGLPIGVGLGIVGSLITTHASPGLDRDPYQVAMALQMIGNLPAVLGYVSLMVLLLHSKGPFARISLFAPLGRMALTNYLTHSLVSSLYFFGYAGGHYGMGRAAQVGFVFVVIALQIVFSHLWLSKFRYGPMEWLWRAITYWQIPPMRREATPVAVGAAA
jgi:uncharacterized membrane protein YeiB